MITHRHLKGVIWKQAFYIHATIGFLLYTIQFSAAIWALYNMGWSLFVNTHFYFVFPTFIAVFFAVLLGILTKCCCKSAADWNTRTILNLKLAHKCLGYLFILGGQGGLITGIKMQRPDMGIDTPIEWIQLAVLVVIVITFEIWHQRAANTEIPFKAAIVSSENRLITSVEFESLIRSGQELVIIDDMVIDVSRFMLQHPGGQFSLRQNIGRDVSKYFHGGYSMENISKVDNHRHSRDAQMIVNALTIGRYVDKAETKMMKVAGVDRKANKAGTCQTFKWKEVKRSVTSNDRSVSIKLLDEEDSSNKQLCPLKDIS